MHETPAPTEGERQEARESVVQRLGLVSMVIWVLAVMGFMWFVFPTRAFKPTIGMMLGSFAFALALVPWVVYPRLLDQELRRRVAQREASPLPPTR